MLKKGAIIQVKLIEAIDENQWIVSFQGALLQVKNTTNIQFKEGLQLSLQVMRDSPLELKILTRKYNHLKFDVVV